MSNGASHGVHPQSLVEHAVAASMGDFLHDALGPDRVSPNTPSADR